MAYATVEELAAKLTIRGARLTADTDGLQRVLDAATVEIDHEIGGAPVSPTDDEVEFLTMVNLGRAQDLWLLEEQAIGVVGLGGETPILSPRDSWVRWANMLAVMKQSWGIA
jgi:hypothetical protein